MSLKLKIQLEYLAHNKSRQKSLAEQLYEAREVGLELREKIATLIETDKDCRPMTTEDCIVGQDFLLIGDDDVKYYMNVVEVHHPGDLWKAFTANDGCIYGIGGAYIINT